MTQTLRIRGGQASRAGRKPENQDSLGMRLPTGSALTFKGVASVIADGVSSCPSAREAAETCVTGFLGDYYSTPDSWSVETAASRVAGAINRWLHGEGTRRYQHGQGMLCTFSALIIKSTTAYLFHVGDSRIYLLRAGQLEQVTRDHQLTLGRQRQFLSRAMGADIHIDIDLRRLPLEVGDQFILTTDGVHGYLNAETITALVAGQEPEAATEALLAAAYEAGSPDNLSAQVLHVEALPNDDLDAHYERLASLKFPPPLEAGQRLDGFRVVREIHSSKRSQVYLAVAPDGERVALKTPSLNYQDEPVYIDQFLTEAWIAGRIQSPHVLAFHEPPAERQFLYHVTEYLDGVTLRNWLHDNPKPSVDQVRDMIAQLIKGLRALHRLEMVHQDLKPENIMIDRDGTVKIIDLGAVRVRGVEQISKPWQHDGFQGTASYAAPECLAGQAGSTSADRYALGVIAYEMLTGQLPYKVTPFLQGRRRPRYRSACRVNPQIPGWLDKCLEKAVALAPQQRYESLSEFMQDLTTPNPQLLSSEFKPLAERLDPESWRMIAGVSLIVNLIAALLLFGPRL